MAAHNKNNLIRKRWYHDCFQVAYAFYFLFFGWFLPQIKKVNYTRHDEQPDGSMKTTEIGHCYYIFLSRYSAKGWRIPFTLKTKQVMNR